MDFFIKLIKIICRWECDRFIKTPADGGLIYVYMFSVK